LVCTAQTSLGMMTAIQMIEDKAYTCIHLSLAFLRPNNWRLLYILLRALGKRFESSETDRV
jgi:hypothetical protein